MWHEGAATLRKYSCALHRSFHVFIVQVIGTRNWWMVAHDSSANSKLLICQRSSPLHVLFLEINRLVHIPYKVFRGWKSYWCGCHMHRNFLFFCRSGLWIPFHERRFAYLTSFSYHRNKFSCLIHEILLLSMDFHAFIYNFIILKISPWPWTL
jgi:hypothetical protein